MSKQGKYKQLFSNSILYSIGNFGSSAVSFLLLPLYTNALTTGQYGYIDIIQTLIDLLLPVLSLNFADSILRYTLDGKHSNKSIMTSVVIVPFMTLPLFYLCLLFISRMTNLHISPELLTLIFFLRINNDYFKQFSRGINKNIIFALNDIIYTLVFALFNLLFLQYLKIGISGYFFSMVIALIVSNMFLIVFSRIYAYFDFQSFSKDYFKESLYYSFPLIPNTIMWWVMNAIDRYFILFFLGVESNGLYGIAYKLPSIVSIVATIFSKAWQISAIKEYNKADTEQFYNRVYSVLNSILVIFVSLMFCILPLFLNLFIGSSFRDVVHIIPFLFISVIFSSLSGFVGTNYLASMKTAGTVKTSIVGGVANIIGNLLLMPLIGLSGAALSTALSFFIVLIYRIYDTRKLIQIHITKVEIVKYFLLTMQATLLTLNTNYYIFQIIIFLFIFLIEIKHYKKLTRGFS